MQYLAISVSLLKKYTIFGYFDRPTLSPKPKQCQQKVPKIKFLTLFINILKWNNPNYKNIKYFPILVDLIKI